KACLYWEPARTRCGFRHRCWLTKSRQTSHSALSKSASARRRRSYNGAGLGTLRDTAVRCSKVAAAAEFLFILAALDKADVKCMVSRLIGEVERGPGVKRPSLLLV